MKILDFLDARDARRMAYRVRCPRQTWDGKLIAAVLFFSGYFVLVFTLANRTVPAPNSPLIRDAILVLGPAIGVIVGAIWRTDRRDEIQAANTGEGFKAMGEQAKATTAAAVAGTGNGSDPNAIREGDAVTLDKAAQE